MIPKINEFVPHWILPECTVSQRKALINEKKAKIRDILKTGNSCHS